MRYTEAKMTQAAEEVLRDIDKYPVDLLRNAADTI